MVEQNNIPGTFSDIIEPYLDDEKVLSLTLACMFLGMSNMNPKATPPGVGVVIQAAQQFHRYLQA